MPVGIEIEGNQNAEPSRALELALPTSTGVPKVADGALTAAAAANVVSASRLARLFSLIANYLWYKRVIPRRSDASEI